MAKVYHGTTDKGLNAILSGEGIKPCSPWQCSDNDGAMYVWPEYKVLDAYGYDEDDKEAVVRHAFESAEIQAVFTQDAHLYVLEIEVPDELLQDDYSCENMADVASFIEVSDFNKSMIIKIYRCDFNKWKSPFLVKNLLGSYYFNKYDLDSLLVEVAEALSSDCYIESEFDFYEWSV